MSESHELKLFCSLLLNSLNEKKQMDNKNYEQLIKMCLSIKNNEMNLQTKLFIVGGVIIGIVAVILFFLLMNKKNQSRSPLNGDNDFFGGGGEGE